LIQQLAEPVKTKLRDCATGARFALTAARVPLANGFCEQLIGTIRQMRRDFLIPRTEQDLLRLLLDWFATTTAAASVRISVRVSLSHLPTCVRLRISGIDFRLRTTAWRTRVRGLRDE